MVHTSSYRISMSPERTSLAREIVGVSQEERPGMARAACRRGESAIVGQKLSQRRNHHDNGHGKLIPERQKLDRSFFLIPTVVQQYSTVSYPHSSV